MAGTKETGAKRKVAGTKVAGTKVAGTKVAGTKWQVQRWRVQRWRVRKWATKVAGTKVAGTRVVGYHYLPVWVHKPITEQGTAFSLVPAAIDSVLWKEMNISAGDAESMLLFLEDTRNNLKGIIELEPF